MKESLFFLVIFIVISCDFKKDNKVFENDKLKTEIKINKDTIISKEKIELEYNFKPQIDDYLVVDHLNCQIINNKSLVFISPTEKQIAEMKKENVDDFYTIADDMNYYFSQHIEFADSLKVNIINNSKRKLEFITDDNDSYVVDLDRNDKGKLSEWTMIGFNPEKKPIFIDILEPDFSHMIEYFKEIEFFDTNVIDNLLIDFIYKNDKQDDFRLALKLREKYKFEIFELLEKSTTDIIFSNLENTRLLMNDSIAKKHLNTNGTEKLIVFNKNQEVIDTIQRNQFEYYQGMIDSYFVATYNLEKKEYSDRYTIISLNDEHRIEINKGKRIRNYQEGLSKKLLASLSFNTDYLYPSFYFMNKKDTIKIISFADYKKGGEKLYLFQNSILRDSLINSFVIRHITPVPIETNDEYIFISSVGIPETDALWDILTGIDKEKIKFSFYETNRLNKKDTLDKRKK